MGIHNCCRVFSLFILFSAFLLVPSFTNPVNSADSIPFPEGNFYFKAILDEGDATESVFTNNKAAETGNLYICDMSLNDSDWMQMLVMQDSREVKIKHLFLKRHEFSGDFAAPLVFMRMPLRKGTALVTETTFGVPSENGTVDVKVKYTSTIEDVVDVEVPAGTFKNCFQIRTYLETERGSGSAIWWYSPSVGFVKILEETQPGILHLLSRYELKK
ncbi:MAG: hypothetical protein PHW98_05260 [Candidatus Omnitrophica bacterium]|nr:hypothetical protein [Candidatus Omnitrophota bacterium]